MIQFTHKKYEFLIEPKPGAYWVKSTGKPGQPTKHQNFVIHGNTKISDTQGNIKRITDGKILKVLNI